MNAHSLTGFEVENLEFRPNGRAILSGLNASFNCGRIYGIIGPNGAGKSTLMKLLARHLRPTSGKVRFAGDDANGWNSRAFAREVAYLPQSLPTAEHQTVRELVALGRYPWHGPFRKLSSEDRNAVDTALDETGSREHENRLVGTLSGGERQRAWIAMVLAQARHFLLLDEPTSALDLAHQARILALLRDIVDRRGIGVALIVHDLNIAAQFCDRILALRDGRLIASDAPSQIMTPKVLTDLYDIPMEVFAHPADGRPVGYIAS